MRGSDADQGTMFSYLSAEDRVPADHPLRIIRDMVDPILARMSPQFAALYPRSGRPSIAPEKLLRALLLQVLYTIRSERQLMEQLDYNILYRWFVGLNLDDPVWVPTVFTKNRERLLRGEIANGFLAEVLQEAERRDWLSDEHFTVDGTFAGSVGESQEFSAERRRVPGPGGRRPGQPDGAFSWGEAAQCDTCVGDRSRVPVSEEECGPGGPVELPGECGD